MYEKISQDEIKRLDAVYHRFLYMGAAAAPAIPNAIKGLSALEIGIINCVSEDPDIILKEIRSRLNVPYSTLTSAINRLEKRGLAERVISPRDKRSFGIRLSPGGVAAQKAHIDFEGRLWERILSKLDTHEERERFLETAEKIVEGCLREGGPNGKD